MLVTWTLGRGLSSLEHVEDPFLTDLARFNTATIFQIQIFSYSLNILDVSLGEATERKEIVIFRARLFYTS